MNVFILFLVLIPYTIPQKTSRDVAEFVEDALFIENGQKVTKKLQINPTEADESNIILYLNTRDNPKQSRIINRDNLNTIDTKKPIVIICHGWISNGNEKWTLAMMNEYLVKADFNVIRVDWSEYSVAPYVSAAMRTRGIGQVIGSYISKLNRTYGLSLQDVHCVGHSLGGHICGFCGKEVIRYTCKKIGRISALDPAKPLFEVPPLDTSNRLSRFDAVLVTVTHTDGGVFGYKKPLGTIDFFPNGGKRLQPGCNLLPSITPNNSADVFNFVFCNHGRAISLFTYSINSHNLYAIECQSEEEFLNGVCVNNSKIVYGDNAPVNAKGSYYFKTNDAPPFRNV